MSAVIDKARELADAISDSEELTDLRDAAQKVEGDETATSMIERFREKQEVAQRAASSGLQMPDEQISDLKAMQGQINSIPSIQVFNEAQGKFNKLMEQVNTIIATALSSQEEGEGPDSCSPGSGCGCGH